VPSDETILRTLRRVGATVTLLLAIVTLYVHELYDRNWADSVVPDVIAVGIPWLVIVVSLSYLTLSVLRGVFERIDKPDPATPETSDEQGSGDGDSATEA
jgi:hypothetical protein